MATAQEIEEAIDKIIGLLKQPHDDDLKLMTFKDVAEIMKVDVKTARRFLSQIPRVKIGKQFRIKKADLVAYIKKHEVK